MDKQLVFAITDLGFHIVALYCLVVMPVDYSKSYKAQALLRLCGIVYVCCTGFDIIVKVLG